MCLFVCSELETAVFFVSRVRMKRWPPLSLIAMRFDCFGCFFFRIFLNALFLSYFSFLHFSGRLLPKHELHLRSAAAVYGGRRRVLDAGNNPVMLCDCDNHLLCLSLDVVRPSYFFYVGLLIKDEVQPPENVVNILFCLMCGCPNQSGFFCGV